MDKQNHAQQISQMIRDLYPALTEDQLKEAEATLRRYFKIVADIQEDQFGVGMGVDTAGRPATMEERSNANLKS
ncbi:hypothetical protein SBA2_840021 [Acidobacteriia bacterium SbA2]|nr:hypothetical protein SBA2_840021 [Acidobacteriia bacterium SbA2]